MSQEKVDRYKQEKANRKQIMKKEKLENLLRKSIVGLVVFVLVGWVGYSAYGTYKANKPKDSVEVDYQAITDYFNEMSQSANAQATE